MIFLNKSQLDKGIEQLKVQIGVEAHLGLELFRVVKGGFIPKPEAVDELMTDEFYNRLLEYFPVFNTVYLTNFRQSIFKFQSDVFSITTEDEHPFIEFRKQWIKDEIERVKAAAIEVGQSALLTPSLKSLYKINLQKHIDHISQYLEKPAQKEKRIVYNAFILTRRLLHEYDKTENGCFDVNDFKKIMPQYGVKKPAAIYQTAKDGNLPSVKQLFNIISDWDSKSNGLKVDDILNWLTGAKQLLEKHHPEAIKSIDFCDFGIDALQKAKAEKNRKKPKNR